jgi:hypothetical protein
MKPKAEIDLNIFQPIPIPVDVAVCPYCGAPMSITSVEITTKLTDGSYYVEKFAMRCTTSPAIVDSPEYDQWVAQHSARENVDWRKSVKPVKTWLNNEFRFIRPWKTMWF